MSRYFTLGTLGLLALACGCTPTQDGAAGNDEAAPVPLVNEDWQIVEMATAHGAFTIEVEVTKGVDTCELARTLIEPLQQKYAEILVYFYEHGGKSDLPILRVQWTAADGYAKTEY